VNDGELALISGGTTAIPQELEAFVRLWDMTFSGPAMTDAPTGLTS
jgi:hypothetical protein